MDVLSISEFSKWHDAVLPEYVYSSENQDGNGFLNDIRFSLRFHNLDARPDIRRLLFSNGDRNSITFDRVKEVRMFNDTGGFVYYLDIVCEGVRETVIRLLCWP